MTIQSIGTTGAQNARLASQTAATVGISHTAAAADGAPVPIQQPDAAQLRQAVASINQTLEKLAPGLEFSIDQESNRAIVRVVDQQTKELIRQMPTAETLEIAKALDRVQGLLISLRA